VKSLEVDQRFKGTHCTQHQGEAVSTSETSDNLYKTTWSNIPEGWLHQSRPGSKRLWNVGQLIQDYMAQYLKVGSTHHRNEAVCTSETSDNLCDTAWRSVSEGWLHPSSERGSMNLWNVGNLYETTDAIFQKTVIFIFAATRTSCIAYECGLEMIPFPCYSCVLLSEISDVGS
jgi:hypothetical protein